MSQETNIEGRRLVIKRTFAAPVERVYLAWTDPNQMVQWFSPNVRWNKPLIDVEPVPGGRYDVTLRHSDGEERRMVGRYGNVVPNERLSFTLTWLGNPSGEEESLVTVEFRTVLEGTELTLTQEGQTDIEALKGASAGWMGFLEMLDCYLVGTPPFGGTPALAV